MFTEDIRNAAHRRAVEATLDSVDRSPGMARYRLIEAAARALLGAIERDTTDGAEAVEDQMWLGHCGVEVEALLAALAMPGGRKAVQS